MRYNRECKAQWSSKIRTIPKEITRRLRRVQALLKNNGGHFKAHQNIFIFLQFFDDKFPHHSLKTCNLI